MRFTRRRFLIDGLAVTALWPGVRLLDGGRLRRRGGTRAGRRRAHGRQRRPEHRRPHRQDTYYRARPTLSLKREALHALDDDHGLHPSLGPLRPLVDNGRLTVVQGVGYPNPDRSHFRSLEIWHGADTGPRTPRVGWLGRLADQIADAAPGTMPALHIGSEEIPLAMRGVSYGAASLADESRMRLAAFPGLATERGARVAGGGGRAGGPRVLA